MALAEIVVVVVAVLSADQIDRIMVAVEIAEAVVGS